MAPMRLIECCYEQSQTLLAAQVKVEWLMSPSLLMTVSVFTVQIKIPRKKV
jgi:hypothetical protein